MAKAKIHRFKNRYFQIWVDSPFAEASISLFRNILLFSSSKAMANIQDFKTRYFQYSIYNSRQDIFNATYHCVHSSILCTSTLCHKIWLVVLADIYLSQLQVITGDTRQFKATLLILQGHRIH